jgi:sigma-B regulation protein RsbU (phosphoserine phosphatase)
MLPYVIKAGFLSKDILINGLFGLGLFKPTQLFGIVGLDFWSHCLMWTTFSNLFVFVTVSILTSQNTTEIETADLCINALSIKEVGKRKKSLTGVNIGHFVEILSNFFGEKYAREKLEEYLHRKGKTIDELGSIDLADLKTYVERTLSKAMGPGAAKLILEKYLETIGSGEKDVMDIFKDIVSFGVGESKDTLVKRLSELNVLLEISNIFSTQESLNDKLAKVINLLKSTFKFDEVVLREKSGNNLFTLACTLKEDENPFYFERKFEDDGSFINRTIKEKKQFAVNDIDTIELNQYSALIKDLGIVSFCHTPIIIEDEVIGIISTFSKLYKNIYTDEFLQILQTIANQIAFSIYNQRQNEKIIHMNALAKEMEVAENIMKVLLPEKPPQIKNLDISGICIPSAYVGGDYYDYFIPEEGVLDVVIADVSGHNIASALIMTEVRSLLKSIIASKCCETTSHIVSKLSSELAADLQKLEFIITLVYLRINVKEQTVTFTNAGHNPPVIFNNNKFYELKGGGPLLGIKDNYNYNHKTIKFKANDLLYLYTDGIVETENSNKEQYGTERLYKLILNNINKPCDNIKEIIVEDLNFFRENEPQKDDITMILIKKET